MTAQEGLAQILQLPKIKLAMLKPPCAASMTSIGLEDRPNRRSITLQNLPIPCTRA